MQEYVYVVMTNAAPGREDEFNAWYSERHVRDVVKVPGIVAARRYMLNDVQRRELPPNQACYMALYEFQTDDLQRTLATLAARAGTAEMPTSDALVRHSSVIYRPLGPIVRAR